MATQTELAAQLNAMTDQVGKIVTEVQALIDAVTAAGNTTPEVDAAMEALKQRLQGLDDMNAG